MSLLIVSMIMHLMYLSVSNYQQIYNIHHSSHDIDWQQFLIMLEKELEQYEVWDVDENSLYLIKNSDQKHLILKHQNHQIYLTPGYHPLLFEVASWQLHTWDDFLFIELIFDNGEYFYGYVKFTGAS
ncbi:ComGF family competence protein [Aerococcaceae bacterium DSM 111020]|nr:ComGF family competence protein [Aerococcaceae bacterium DSM 111020]